MSFIPESLLRDLEEMEEAEARELIQATTLRHSVSTLKMSRASLGIISRPSTKSRAAGEVPDSFPVPTTAASRHQIVGSKLSLADTKGQSASATDSQQAAEELTASTTKPATRKDAVALQLQMQKLLAKLPQESTTAGRNALEILLDAAEQEQEIYDQVFAEVIAQVTSHTTERGQVLQQVRQRYAQLFKRVPQQVAGVFHQSVADRVIIKRLVTELSLTADTLAQLMVHCEQLYKPANPLLAQLEAFVLTQGVQERVINGTATEHRLSQVHNVQRRQLEDQLREANQQRKKWSRHALKVSTVMSRSLGWSNSVRELSLRAEDRTDAMNELLGIVSKSAQQNWAEVERIFADWRETFRRISYSGETEQQRRHKSASAVLVQLRRCMKEFFPVTVNPQAATATSTATADNPILLTISLADKQELQKLLLRWFADLQACSIQKSSAHQAASWQSERKLLLETQWDRYCTKLRSLLARCDKWSGSADKSYLAMSEQLDTLYRKVITWFQGSWARIIGDEVTSAAFVTIANQMEDRQGFIASGNPNEPLGVMETAMLKESLARWIGDLSTAVNAIQQSITSDPGDEILQPLEHITYSLQPQMAVDLTFHIDETNRIYDTALEWLVGMVDGGMNKEKQWTSQESAMCQINADWKEQAVKLSGLTTEIPEPIISLAGVDIVKLINDSAAKWAQTAKELVVVARRNSQNEADINPVTSNGPKKYKVPVADDIPYSDGDAAFVSSINTLFGKLCEAAVAEKED